MTFKPTSQQVKAFYWPWAWRQTRALVKKRDGNACTACGSSDRLQVDHILELCTPEGWARRLDPTNLTALCRRCHHTKTRRRRAARQPTPQRRTSRQW